MRRCPALALIVMQLVAFPCLGQQDNDRSTLNLFFQRQEYDKAIDYLQSMAPVADSNLQYTADLGYALLMNEQYDMARRQFRELFRRQPSNFTANLYLGQLYEQFKQTDSALYHYLLLTRLQPGNYRFWQKAAQLFSSIANYDSALHYIAKSYALKPRSGHVAVQYINLLTLRKQYEQIEPLLDEFLLRDSTNAEVIVKRMEISFRKPDYATVIFWGERLLDDSADVIMPYVNLAYSYLNVDSIDKCIALCQWLIEGNKAMQPVLYCDALALAKKKKYRESNDLLDECLKMSIQKDAIGYFDAKSDNYEEMKQYAKAISCYDTAYYIFHSLPELYYAGRVYDKYLRNRGKARLYYQRFMDKRKTPRNNGEVRVFEYIREYLKGGER